MLLSTVRLPRVREVYSMCRRVVDHRNDANEAETFLCVFTELPTKKQQLHALNLLVLLLPEANRDTLKVDAQGLKLRSCLSTSPPKYF